MDFITPPILPMIYAVAIFMVIGYFWYSHYLFGNIWKKELGIPPEETEGALLLIGALFNGIVISYFLYLFVSATGAQSLFEGAKVGFFVSLGFVATTHFSAFLWAKKPLRVFVLDSLCMMITLPLAGAALTL